MNTPTAARRSRETEAVHWSVTDGRTLVGTIDLIDGSYVATDIHGEITGTFGMRLEAARSLPSSTDSGGRATGCLPRKTDYQPTNLQGGFPW
jgi:hypothetical protein